MRKTLMLLLGLFALCTQLRAQRIVTGTVTDDKGIPLPNVSVQIKGTNTGTVTNENGSFSVNIPAKGRTLVFSSVNMTTREVAIGTSPL